MKLVHYAFAICIDNEDSLENSCISGGTGGIVSRRTTTISTPPPQRPQRLPSHTLHQGTFEHAAFTQTEESKQRILIPDTSAIVDADQVVAPPPYVNDRVTYIRSPNIQLTAHLETRRRPNASLSMTKLKSNLPTGIKKFITAKDEHIVQTISIKENKFELKKKNVSLDDISATEPADNKGRCCLLETGGSLAQNYKCCFF